MPGIAIVRRAAIVCGIALPLAETVRRSAHLAEWWLWIDDYLIGAGLLLGAWASRHRSPAGLRTLTAGWGIAAGMGYYSFVGHVMDADARDVSGAPGVVLAVVVGAGWLLALAMLASSIIARK
jgi:hypothetical protein